MRNILDRYRPLRAPDGDGAGGAGDGGDKGGAGGGGADKGGAGGAGDIKIGGADGAQLSLYKPEGIADHLLGQDDKGTIDKLMGAYKGARDEIAKGKPTPVKAGDYKFEWSDKVKGSIPADDPAVKAFAEIAEQAGFGQDQMAAIPKFFDLAVDKGWIEKPFDSAGLLTSLAPAEFKGTPEEKQTRGGERLTTAENWIKQLDSKVIDDKMKGELRLLTTSLDGVRLVEQFMKSGMNSSFNPGGGGGGQQSVTKEALDARVADPRNDSTRHDKYNEDFAAETRRLFKQMYPD
ncbi:hypothetical protein [Mesorhizobium sp. M1399]|uniref:hypothetical protein n=1 Tax=Mesorhizobium sp. M1399 TaxID=2957096 RepID=UPI0033353AFA